MLILSLLHIVLNKVWTGCIDTIRGREKIQVIHPTCDLAERNVSSGL